MLEILVRAATGGYHLREGIGLESPDDDIVYDVFGVGFGPSNLALAIALHEYNETVSVDRRLRFRFVERQPTFSWHGNMLLPGTIMQVSFLKDLATLRNPVSRFGFISYLHERERLAAFINHKTLFPSRHEFHDYLEWAARPFEGAVSYGCEATEIRVVPANGGWPTATELRITTTEREGGGQTTWRARNLVVATGLSPWLPDGVTASDRVWHSEHFLARLAALPRCDEPEFVVVGAGQSSAEITEYLLGHFPASRVHAVMSRYGYSPADDSPFANEIFDAVAIETFFHSPDEVKKSLVDYHSNTNYSVVDVDLINTLYRYRYQDLVTGGIRLSLHRTSRVTGLSPSTDRVGVTIECRSSGMVENVNADAVVFASGYRPNDPMRVLGNIARFCNLDAHGRPRVGLDYRLETSGDVDCGIYLQGLTEHTHGLSSSLLSNIAVRAGHIVESVTKPR